MIFDASELETGTPMPLTFAPWWRAGAAKASVDNRAWEESKNRRKREIILGTFGEVLRGFWRTYIKRGGRRAKSDVAKSSNANTIETLDLSLFQEAKSYIRCFITRQLNNIGRY